MLSEQAIQMKKDRYQYIIDYTKSVDTTQILLEIPKRSLIYIEQIFQQSAISEKTDCMHTENKFSECTKIDIVIMDASTEILPQ